MLVVLSPCPIPLVLLFPMQDIHHSVAVSTGNNIIIIITLRSRNILSTKSGGLREKLTSDTKKAQTSRSTVLQ